MSEQDSLREAIAQFVGAVEVVFDEDWDYSQGHLLANGGRLVGSGTFLRPGGDAMLSNWGARLALLDSYERLLTAMKNSGLEAQLPTRDDWFNYDWTSKD